MTINPGKMIGDAQAQIRAARDLQQRTINDANLTFKYDTAKADMVLAELREKYEDTIVEYVNEKCHPPLDELNVPFYPGSIHLNADGIRVIWYNNIDSREDILLFITWEELLKWKKDEVIDHTNFPVAKPIPIDVLKTFEAQIDWDKYYGRWGTETLVYTDYYNENVPEHLKGKVTHVWMYFEK